MLHDADVWCDGLPEAVSAVADGHSWAIPHRQVYRLSKDGTDAYLRRQPWKFKLDQQPYEGMLGGGIIVAQRDVLLRVPIDPRFIGWGQEDESHGMALWTIEGAPWRGTSDLIHLWHPPQDRLSSPVRVGAGLGAPTPVYACEIRS